MEDFFNEMSYQEILNRFDIDPSTASGFTESMVHDSIVGASHYFGLPIPMIFGAGDTTGVMSMDNTSPFDDVLMYNFSELHDLGINDKASLDLVMSHESIHRVLSATKHDYGVWENELACDFLTAMRAGREGINIDIFKDAIESTLGGSTHPSGNLRADFIQKAYELGQNQIENDFSVEKDLIAFQEHLDYRSVDIEVCKSTLLSLSNEMFADSHNISNFVNDKDWHIKEAQWHTERGEHSEANEHIRSAKMCSK